MLVPLVRRRPFGLTTHHNESDCHEGQAQGPHPSQRPPLVPTEQGRAYVIQSTTGVVEPYGRICIKQDQGGNVEARYRFDLRSDPLSMCDIWPEGDRKGPHPSASSTPASTKNEPGEPLRSHSRGGGWAGKGGDPCGRLSCFSTGSVSTDSRLRFRVPSTGSLSRLLMSLPGSLRK